MSQLPPGMMLPKDYVAVPPEVTKQIREAHQNKQGYMVCIFQPQADGRILMDRFSGNWDYNKWHFALEAFVAGMLKINLPQQVVDVIAEQKQTVNSFAEAKQIIGKKKDHNL